MKDRQYCVYIMTNAHNTVLYTGVTNCLQRRILEHKSGTGSKFVKKYNVTKLVYFECGEDVSFAILREKQITEYCVNIRTKIPLFPSLSIQESS